MPLDPNRVEELFHAAQQVGDPDQRRALLETACAGDTALRQRVEALLGADAEASQFLKRPAIEHPQAAPPGSEDLTQGFDPSSPDASAFASGQKRRAEHDENISFLQPTSRADSLGRLGHYEILETIGQGGFGIVLRAFDEKLHRVVAIKALSPAYAANGSARKRFIREARTAAAIKNEHVVGIYDVEEDAQPPYLAMEMIDGVSLQEKIDKHGPLGLKEILRIGLQMAEGLAAAHKQGLVHRDIKPANILLENGVERVKITDFGLARAVDDASVTQSGTVAGTPMYMSPEQAEGLPIDHRSDLFSLGTVLYAMCTGHPAFRASGTHAVLKRVIDASPRPIREINPEIPDWLCAIIARLHAKRPEDRFQSAKEVADLLNRHLAHEQNPAQVPRPAAVPFSPPAGAASQTRGQWLPVAIALALFVLVGLVAIGWVMLNGIALFRRVAAAPASKAVLSIELSDPKIEFRIDGYGANLTAVSVYQVPLEAGEHRVWFKLDEVELETTPFVLQSGERSKLRLQIGPEQASARFKDLPLGIQQLAGNRLLSGALPATADLTYRLPWSAEGWVQLFNGKDLAGWKAIPPQHWRVEDGVIKGSGPDAFLFTNAGDFDDFHLAVEYRINENGDSGIHFRAPAPRPSAGRWGYSVIGLEAEVSVRKHVGYRSGALTVKDPDLRVLAASKIPPHAPQEWARLELIARQDRIQILVNGKLVTDYTDSERRFQRGHIALCSWEGANIKTDVEFRKVEIRGLALDDRLQGFWKTVSGERGGVPWPAHEVEKFHMSFSGNLVRSSIDTLHSETTFRVDAGHDPRVIHFVRSPTHTPMHGIYRVQGDELTLCIRPLEAPRPSAFDSKSGTDVRLILLKREAPSPLPAGEIKELPPEGSP